MENITYTVYIKTDDQNRIIAVNSSAFLTDTGGWTQIDEGTGDRYHHAQGNYFEEPIYTMDGIARYKLVDGLAAVRSEREVDADRAAMPVPEPTDIEVLQYENKLLTAQVNALTTQNDFQEELIVELASEVYA